MRTSRAADTLDSMKADEPVVFYHGTRRGFTRGGYLMPRSTHQGEGTTAPLSAGQQALPDSEHYVYVTTSLELAWVYAWHAVGRGKPKVLEVNPVGSIEPDPEHSAAMQAYRVDGYAKVLKVLTEPVMTEQEAREGWVQ